MSYETRFDRALEQLKTESTPAWSNSRQPRRTVTLKWAATATVLAVGAVILWPNKGQNAAWAQIQAKARSVQSVQEVTYTEGDPRPYAVWAYSPSGLGYAMFNRKSRELEFLSIASSEKSVSMRGFARSASSPMRLFVRGTSAQRKVVSDELYNDMRSRSDFSKILSGGKQVGEPVSIPTPEGARMRYHIVSDQVVGKRTYHLDRFYDVDPATNLVYQCTAVPARKGSPKLITKFAYPERLDVNYFLRLVPSNVKTIDADLARKQILADFTDGLGTQRVAGKAVTLRALFRDSYGIWVLWSGAPKPDGALPEKVAIHGLHPVRIDSLNAFTQRGDTRHKTNLGGMFLNVTGEAPERLTVHIPVLDANGKRRLGTATFKNVPLRETEIIYELGKLLGR